MGIFRHRQHLCLPVTQLMASAPQQMRRVSRSVRDLAESPRVLPGVWQCGIGGPFPGAWGLGLRPHRVLLWEHLWPEWAGSGRNQDGQPSCCAHPTPSLDQTGRSDAFRAGDLGPGSPQNRSALPAAATFSGRWAPLCFPSGLRRCFGQLRSFCFIHPCAARKCLFLLSTRGCTC